MIAELFTFNTGLYLGGIAIVGVIGSLIVRQLRLPGITGYLLIGVLLGPSVTGFLHHDTVAQYAGVVTPLGLAFIAYSIGGSLPLSSLKGLLRSIITIILCEGTLAWIFVLVLVTVTAPLVLPDGTVDFESSLAMGLILGAISLATAPGVTMAIIADSGAKGPLTTTLITVVAFDNILAVSAYAITAGLIVILFGAADTMAPAAFLASEFFSIASSIVLGATLALPLLWLSHYARDRKEKLSLILGMLFLAAGLSEYLHLHPIITNMALGFTIVNVQSQGQDLIKISQDVEGVIFVVFFTIAGAHLDLSIITASAPLAIIIVLGRSFGKLLGAWVGAKTSGAPEVVTTYLGLTLMPIAGVTVGLAMLVEQTPELDPISQFVITSLLATTLINEIIAPPLSKFALEKSGEATAN
jgi:Kef-type K+ transport system membrane component KefB